MFDFFQYLQKNQALVNQHLKAILNRMNPHLELIRAMDHSLMAGGKRLRPILSMAAAQACGRNFLLALPVGCAIEMIHTYSLIHDDLPAMDNDDLRRGLPTCHKQFCEATAILAGDALLTLAFEILARPDAVFDKYPDESTRIKLMAKISRAAGALGMVEGQMLDMQSYPPNQEDTLAHLKKIHAYKTGAMIRVSVEAGALSVGADPERIKNLIGYSENIGLAFQVMDDILNVEGDPRIMGKAKGSDLLNDKMTFPAIIGLDASKKYAKTLVNQAIESILKFDDKDCLPLRAIADYIINRDH